MARFAIFGDSYVRRLNFHCIDKHRIAVPGTVKWFHKGGLRTDRMDHYLYQRVLHEEADVVIINLGGNDITPVSTPEEIFRRICGIVDDLYDSGVKSVFIAEILTRGDFTKCPGLTKTVFEKQRFSVNKKLAKKKKKNTKKNKYHT